MNAPLPKRGAALFRSLARNSGGWLTLLASLALVLAATPQTNLGRTRPNPAHRLVTLPAGAAQVSGELPWHPPRIKADDSLREYGAVSSFNWSGYAVTGSAGSVTAVSGTWTVPAVTGAAGTYSSIWVGLDGFTDSTVEQIGTAQDTSGTKYYAWWEMYPAAPVMISIVNVGDVIEAGVTYQGNSSYLLTLTDATAGWTFSTTKVLAGAQNASAEWIVEAPSSISGVLPLADFGTASFTGECLATIGTTTGPIGGFSTFDSITMVARNRKVKALPSALQTDATADGAASDGTGDAFFVTWQHQ